MMFLGNISILSAASSLLLMTMDVQSFVVVTSKSKHQKRSFSMPKSNQLRSITGVPDIATSTSLSFNFDQMGELTKSIAIVAFLGGGLIPPAIAANKLMLGTILGQRAGGDDDSVAKVSTSASSVSPDIPNSKLLFAREPVKLADVVAIVGRIRDVQSVADWKNLPSAKRDNLVDPENPPMWLPRGMFKDNIRNAKFVGWPVDPNTGEVVGGIELKSEFEREVSKKSYPIPDVALDAVFDTWAWGSGIATPDKVDVQLQAWRSNNGFDLNKFASAAVAGRSVTGAAILTFITIQVMVYGCLFVAPFLRVFFDIDIGFGKLGECPSGMCTTIF